MTDIWFWSDPHLFHSNILKFLDDKGERFRPFSCIEEMHEIFVDKCKVVKPQDHFYWLGDVTMRYDRPFRELMHRFNGHKRLILGNHDRVKGTCLMDYFEKVSLWRVWNDLNVIFTHVPLSFEQMRKRHYNGHGHIHQNNAPSDRHINLCVEKTNWGPVHIDEIAQKVGKL